MMGKGGLFHGKAFDTEAASVGFGGVGKPRRPNGTDAGRAGSLTARVTPGRSANLRAGRA